MRPLTVRLRAGDFAGEKVGRLRLVAFDMDGVLTNHVSSWRAVHDALGTHNQQAVDAYNAGLIDDREFILRDVALWRAANPDLGRKDLAAILAKVPRMGGMTEAVRALQAEGVRCVIVTGGLRQLAQMLREEAPFDEARSNDVVFGRDGRLADDAVVGVPLRGKAGVLQAIQQELGVPPEETGSVGDSHFDVGLFARSRVAVAFNPLDEHVAARASAVVRSLDLRDAVAPLLERMTTSR
jgi:phosphoserine phosphatase